MGNEIMTIDTQTLLQKAIEDGASIEILERLMDMARSIKKDFAEEEFRKAMTAFQSECPIIKKSKSVKEKDKDSVRYKYAPLDDILKEVMPIICKNGLSYDIESLMTPTEPIMIIVTVTVFHILGHSKKTSFQVPIDSRAFMSEPQKWASAQTFAKRYAFCNAFGILTGDMDDDNNSMSKNKKIDTPEDYKQLDSLPENIKEGFRILQYTRKTVLLFCEKFNWDNAIIMKNINMIVDAKNAK